MAVQFELGLTRTGKIKTIMVCINNGGIFAIPRNDTCLCDTQSNYYMSNKLE